MKYPAAALLGVIALLEPTVKFAAVLLFAILLDCWSAYDLSRRLRRRHPGRVEGRFQSRYALRMLRTFIQAYTVVLLLYLVDTVILSGFRYLNLSNIGAAVFCGIQLWSILENMSSASGARWAKILQRIMVDKAKRHFDIHLTPNPSPKERGEKVLEGEESIAPATSPKERGEKISGGEESLAPATSPKERGEKVLEGEESLTPDILPEGGEEGKAGSGETPPHPRSPLSFGEGPGVRWVLIGLFLSGCCSHRPVATAERETVTVTETVRDTVVTVQPDASMIRALLECDEERQVVVRELLELQAGRNVHPPQITVKGNILTATAEVDSFAVYLQWKQRERQTETVRTETVTVNRLTGWQWFQMWTGRLAWLALAGWIIFKFLINH